jgi:hypothetical protein
LLSRTVPVIVASPRLPLPIPGVADIARMLTMINEGTLIRKNFLIAAGPPG